MSAPPLHLRRANVDDLPALRELWKAFGLNAADLEKRITEFQIIETIEGGLLGSIGFKVAGKEGLIHSEAYLRPEQEQELRERLWERVLNLARNHALVRLWTEERAPFWTQHDFLPAQPGDLEKLPPLFGPPQGAWNVIQIRNEIAPSGLSLDAEFELFRQANKESTERLIRQAKVMKFVAGVIAFFFFLIVVVGVIILMRQRAAPPPIGAP